MRRSYILGVTSLCALACGSARYGASDQGAPSITLPVNFAEGHQPPGIHGGDGGIAVSTPPSPPSSSGTAPVPTGSGPGGPGPGAPRTGSAPNPVPLTTANQWEFSLAYEKGALSVEGVKKVVLERPTPTARRFGRFAIELWVGRELVDRVRFDFPMLGGDAAPEGKRRPLHDQPRFAPGAETRQRVLVPDSERATSAALVDRLTGDALPITWPPTPSEPMPAPSATPLGPVPAPANKINN